MRRVVLVVGRDSGVAEAAIARGQVLLHGEIFSLGADMAGCETQCRRTGFEIGLCDGEHRGRVLWSHVSHNQAFLRWLRIRRPLAFDLSSRLLTARSDGFTLAAYHRSSFIASAKTRFQMRSLIASLRSLPR